MVLLNERLDVRRLYTKALARFQLISAGVLLFSVLGRQGMERTWEHWRVAIVVLLGLLRWLLELFSVTVC